MFLQDSCDAYLRVTCAQHYKPCATSGFNTTAYQQWIANGSAQATLIKKGPQKYARDVKPKRSSIVMIQVRDMESYSLTQSMVVMLMLDPSGESKPSMGDLIHSITACYALIAGQI